MLLQKEERIWLKRHGGDLLPFSKKLAVAVNTRQLLPLRPNFRASYLDEYRIEHSKYIVKIDRFFEGYIIFCVLSHF
jgi:hypothetical protein